MTGRKEEEGRRCKTRQHHDRITLAELRRRYDAAIQKYDCSDVTEANAAHRQACEIGEMLHEAGFGPTVEIPEDVSENLAAAESACAFTITLPEGYCLSDLTRARWRTRPSA